MLKNSRTQTETRGQRDGLKPQMTSLLFPPRSMTGQKSRMQNNPTSALIIHSRFQNQGIHILLEHHKIWGQTTYWTMNGGQTTYWTMKALQWGRVMHMHCNEVDFLVLRWRCVIQAMTTAGQRDVEGSMCSVSSASWEATNISEQNVMASTWHLVSFVNVYF